MSAGRDQDDEARLADASAWIVRLQDPQASDAEAFDAWLSASEANGLAYDRALAVWDEFGAAGPEVLAGLAAAADRIRERGFGWRRGLIAAGGLAAAAAVALAVLPQVAAPPTEQVFATAHGERRTVKLADGSTIDMNAGSRLTVALGRGERRVAMSDGEAVFDVAADARRPFLIAAGDRTVRVVGTQFDVRRRGDELSVTVARGVVEVRPAEGASGAAFRLHPGQRLDHLQGAPDGRVSAAEPQEVFGWRAGRLVYRDQPLSQVVEDLNLQFDRPIRLEDRVLGQTRISGVLVLDNEAAIIRRLALMVPITAVPTDSGVLLKRDGASKR
ncbi:FecR family protein [Phenylobacterium hankyongense]|nr:FecR domain-containing protein [Phenylobacterium hankyongense]